MCQAYENERNSIVIGERHNTLKGFAAAMIGKPQSANPHPDHGKYDYDRIAWSQGWGCWQEGILPYVLEVEFKKKYDIELWWKIQNQFKATRELPGDMKLFVQRYIE